MSTFRVGQRVVCISNMANKPHENSGIVEDKAHFLVEVDEIYTIEAIEYDEDGEWLLLVEVPGWQFESTEFRPLKMDYDFVEEIIKQVTPVEV